MTAVREWANMAHMARENARIGFILIVLVPFLLAMEQGCKKKKEGPPAQAVKPQQGAKQPAPAPSPRRKTQQSYKGYTMKVVEAVKTGDSMGVKVSIANESSKKKFKKMTITLDQYASNNRVLSSLHKTVDISGLRPGSSTEMTLEFRKTHPRVHDVEARITGLR